MGQPPSLTLFLGGLEPSFKRQSNTLAPFPTFYSQTFLLAPLHPPIQKKGVVSTPLSVKLGYGTKNWESVRVSQVKQTNLVTSGAGYIGSHAVWAMLILLWDRSSHIDPNQAFESWGQTDRLSPHPHGKSRNFSRIINRLTTLLLD